MSGHQSFRLLADPLLADPGRAAEVDQKYQAILQGMDLTALRRSRGQTQREVAQTMGVSQANISRIERGEDAQISTLRKYVRALGGELELRATFQDAPDSSAPIGRGDRARRAVS